MTLSPSVEQLFSLSSSSVSSDADSSIKSQPVIKKTKPSRGVIAKKSSNTKYISSNNTNATNRNNSKVRASSLSPTKTASTPNSSKYINNNNNTGFKPPRSGQGFSNGGRTPPRSPKPRSQRGASTSSSCTHNKSSTAMTKNNNNTSYENHSDSSTSVSSKSSKGYVKLATLTTSEESSRVRNSQSFSMVPKKNDDLFAGSAASPDATALPQPPKAWLIDFDIKRTDLSTFLTDAATTTGSFKENRARNFSAPIKPTTTTTPPPPANVQKFFASFTLVSTTA